MTSSITFPAKCIDPQKVAELRAWVLTHRDHIVSDIAAFVNIETPSTDKALLDTGLEWITARTLELLGPPTTQARVDGGQYGDILVLEYIGEIDATVTVLCHYDTVWEEGTLASWPYSVDGDTARGPGIYDMKTGCVQSIWSIAALSAVGVPRPTVRIIFNGDEEIGTFAAQPIIEENAKSSTAVVVFEPSEEGKIKTERKGIGRFWLTVTGVATHAGADYLAGTSAIDELARITLTLHALTDVGRGTTVNVGEFNGGTRANVMAASATAAIDVRVTTPDEMSRIDAAIAAITPHSPRASLAWTGGWNRPPMPRTGLTIAPYDLAAEIAGTLGIDLGEISVGGGSDGNYAAAMNIPVLDGMGAVGAHPHSPDEFIIISESIDRIPVAAAFIASIGRR